MYCNKFGLVPYFHTACYEVVTTKDGPLLIHLQLLINVHTLFLRLVRITRTCRVSLNQLREVNCKYFFRNELTEDHLLQSRTVLSSRTAYNNYLFFVDIMTAALLIDILHPPPAVTTEHRPQISLAELTPSP